MSSNDRQPSRRKKKNNGIPMLIALAVVAVILVVVLIVLITSDGGSKKNSPKGNSKFALKNETYNVELGSDMSNVIANEIVTGDGGLIAAAKINADNVDFNKVGEYKATVTSGEYSLDFTVKVADTTAPVITLKSESVNVMKSGQVTADSFIESVDDKSSYTTGVIKDVDASSPADDVQDSISYDTTGTYTIGVVAKDEYGNYDMKKVTVNVTDIDYSAILNSGVDVTIPAGTDFSQYKTDKVPYGFSTTDVDEHNRPGGCSYYDKLYGMYAADFIQPYSNYIYLTFDEGYEYGFTPSILDTLKEKGVKAVFFVTLPYAKDNPELVQRMIDEGHVIGNHTTTHPSGGLQQYSAQKQVDDINQVTQYIKEKFNYDMYLFRFPEGSFSEQSLAIVQSLGLRSVFWSFAYRDWVVDDQPDVAESLQAALDRSHGGAIYLLHAESETNTKMLGDLIDGLKKKGFDFGYYAKMD